MIKDADTLSTLQNEWTGVRRMRDRMRLLLAATFTGGAYTAPALSGILYNLPLLLAFDVLGQVLIALRAQGDLICDTSRLGHLVDAAKEALPWLDWQETRDGVRRRNQVAHDGILHDAELCVAQITAVERQLVAWGVIDAA
jgi:hypothetical protein